MPFDEFIQNMLRGRDDKQIRDYLEKFSEMEPCLCDLESCEFASLRSVLKEIENG